MAKPITREFMEHLVESQIHIHEEALDETIADNLRAIVERTLNGWKALRSLLLEPDRQSITTVEQSSSPKKCPSCGFVEPGRRDAPPTESTYQKFNVETSVPDHGSKADGDSDERARSHPDPQDTRGEGGLTAKSAEDGKGDFASELRDKQFIDRFSEGDVVCPFCYDLAKRLQKQRGAETAGPSDATHGDATHSVTREWVKRLVIDIATNVFYDTEDAKQDKINYGEYPNATIRAERGLTELGVEVKGEEDE